MSTCICIYHVGDGLGSFGSVSFHIDVFIKLPN